MRTEFIPYAAALAAMGSEHYMPGPRRAATPLGTVHDKDAHPQLHRFTVRGVEIEARSRKEAIKKYNLRHK